MSEQDAFAAVVNTKPFNASTTEGQVREAIEGYRDAMTYVLRLAGDPHFRWDATLLRSLHFMMVRHAPQHHPGGWRPGAIYVRDDRVGEIVYRGPDAEAVPGLIDELITWLAHENEAASPLTRAAMAHLNLVLIHPFSDGNGRMARCLQTLVLARAGMLDPTFCSIEEYLGRNTDSYFAVLAAVSGGSFQPTRDTRPWVRFNLTAHFRQATTVLRRQSEMALVWEEVEVEIRRHGLHERACPALVEAAFGYSIRNAGYRAHAEVSALVASRDLKSLVEADLLEAVGDRRGRYYVASAFLKALRERHRPPTPAPDPFLRMP